MSHNQNEPIRMQHEFERTTCGCEFCRVPCRHAPGGLDPSDLLRLCPDNEDVFTWAEKHLRAMTHRPYPTLVPARQENGHCHWLLFGHCTVHRHAPYGCAFFDTHMSVEESGKRQAATIKARTKDADDDGLYSRVWRHLRSKGLIAPRGDREGWYAEARRMTRHAERKRRNLR